MHRWLTVLCLCLLVATRAPAWQPSRWVWFSWPYAFENTGEDWYWIDAGDTQWVFQFAVPAGWRPFQQSGLASGWSWWAWPYAYDCESGGWCYADEAPLPWCVNLGTGTWSAWGATAVPPGMLRIPAGSFQMGDGLGEGAGDETPLHQVSVSAFCMDVEEVSKARWDDVSAWAVAHGYQFDQTASGKETNHPAHSVNWYDAVKWCNARSEREGRVPAYYTGADQGSVLRTGRVDAASSWVRWSDGYRLPTEAEWERAACGTGGYARFPWTDSPNISHQRANYYSYWLGGIPFYPYDTSTTSAYHPAYASGALPYTSPAGSLAPSSFDLHDLAGNVAEWCWDQYGGYGSTATGDPHGPDSGSDRVHRGGSWDAFATRCRRSARGHLAPGIATNNVGFRCVIPIQP